jgi:4-amino-4-deoxy-L-arabinose transferase-like glycosyltransferase
VTAAEHAESRCSPPRSSPPTRILLFACLVTALALRLAFALFYWVDQPLTHDEREYLALGRSVARGEGFHYPADEPAPGTAQQFGRAPGYPLFLAMLGVTDRVERAPQRVQIAQAFVGLTIVWLIASIAWRAAGPRAGVAAAAMAAVYPPLVWTPAYVLSETLFSALALGAARLLQPHPPPEGTPSRALIAAAILTGAGILTRPSLIFFLPFAAFWLWRSRRAADAAIFLFVAALCVAPWTIRNHRVYGRWIAVASEGGVTFWTGNHPLAIGEGDLAANPEIKRAELAFRAAHPGMTAEELEPHYYRDAFAWIRDNPGAWLWLMARKAFYTAVPAGPSYAVHSAKYVAASVTAYVLVLSAAMAGAWRWRRSGKRPGPVPLWLMAASTVTAGLVFFPQERFRIPVIDPALIVTAALAAGLRNYERTHRHTDV